MMITCPECETEHDIEIGCPTCYIHDEHKEECDGCFGEGVIRFYDEQGELSSRPCGRCNGSGKNPRTIILDDKAYGALGRIIDYLYTDEQTDWEASGKPRNHIFVAIHDLARNYRWVKKEQTKS